LLGVFSAGECKPKKHQSEYHYQLRKLDISIDDETLQIGLIQLIRKNVIVSQILGDLLVQTQLGEQIDCI